MCDQLVAHDCELHLYNEWNKDAVRDRAGKYQGFADVRSTKLALKLYFSISCTIATLRTPLSRLLCFSLLRCNGGGGGNLFKLT